jgi:hypothetical protein
MKNIKIIVFTAIVSVGLTISGPVFAIGATTPPCLLTGSGLGGKVCPPYTPTSEEQAQDQKTAEILAKLKQSPYYDSSLNTMLFKMLSHIDELETRIAILEANQNIIYRNSSTSNVTNTKPPCLSISEQVKKGYVYNICTGVKLK